MITNTGQCAVMSAKCLSCRSVLYKSTSGSHVSVSSIQAYFRNKNQFYCKFLFVTFSERSRAIVSFPACPTLPLVYQNAKNSPYKIFLSAGQGQTFQNNMQPPSSSFITVKALYFSTLFPSFFTLQRSV